MKRYRPLLSLVAFLSVACASTGEHAAVSDRPGSEAPDAQVDEQDVKEAEHALGIARARLEIAKLEHDAWAAGHEAEVHHATIEAELAQSKLDRFRNTDAPQRIASEELDLQSVKDRAQEAVDELAQIEIMYADQDLDDVTAEFVVSRGRRQAARAQRRIEIQETTFRALGEQELPAEEKRLELDLARTQAALAKLERRGEIERRQKEVAIQEAEHAAGKAEHELEEKTEEKTEVQP